MYFSTLVAFAALLFLVGATPVSPNTSRTKGPRSIPLSKHSPNHLNRDGRVDSRKVQAAIRQTEAKYDRAFSAYEKRTGETHPLALKRRHSNDPRSLFTTPLNETVTETSNVVWTVNAWVGTPGQSFSVQLDTMSPDSFLCGITCQTCSGHNLYDLFLSSTAEDQKKQGSLSHLNGPVNGDVVTDMINIGGGDARVEFVVASNIGPIYQSSSFPGDGCVGLGLKQESTLGVNSWFTDITESHDGAARIFALDMSPAGSGPQLVFGGTNLSMIAGSLTYIKLTKKAMFWEIPLDSVMVNGNNLKITNYNAVFDSSSIFIQGAPEDITNLYSNIPGSTPDPLNSGHFLVPCDTSVDVVYKFGGRGFTIAPDDYIIGPAENKPGLCVAVFFSSSSYSFWRMGTAFMETVYSEFDEQNWQIGLGQPA